MYTNLRFSRHARQRMEEMGLNERGVWHIIQNYTVSYRNRAPHQVVYCCGGYAAVVDIIQEVVITVLYRPEDGRDYVRPKKKGATWKWSISTH